MRCCQNFINRFYSFVRSIPLHTEVRKTILGTAPSLRTQKTWWQENYAGCGEGEFSFMLHRPDQLGDINQWIF